MQDVTANDDVRQRIGRDAASLDHHYQHLLPVATGVLHGPQNAARAELAAVAYLLINMDVHCPDRRVEIRTDSKYVVDIINRICNAPGSSLSYKSNNFDLIKILVDKWKPSTHSIIKVKAHLNLHETSHINTKWDTISNHVVDRVAARALENDSSELRDAAHKVAQFKALERKRLKQVYEYIVDLNASKMAIERNSKQQNSAHKVYSQTRSELKAIIFIRFTLIK